MNRSSIILTAFMLTLPTIAHGAAGDVAFRIDDRVWHVDQGGLSLSLDMFLDIEAQSSVSAIGWGAVLTISPQPGAVGTASFAPPTIVGNLPNLSPASTNAYLDFDLDEGGKSYGELAESPYELNAFSAYIEPTLGPPPSVDSSGNLSLPNGSGLASLPIALSADARGSYLIEFNNDPRVTGLVYATGLAEPDDIAVHPVGSHTAGLLSIVGIAGDYNNDGSVNIADYTKWRNNLGAAAGTLLNDPTGATVGTEQYDTWKANFGNVVPAALRANASVPEPSTCVLLALFAVASICHCLLARH